MSTASSKEDLDSDCNNVIRHLGSTMDNRERLSVLKSSLRSVYKHEIVNIFKEVGIWDPTSNKFKSRNPDWNHLKTKLEECKAAGWKQSAASAQDLDTESEDEDTHFELESSCTTEDDDDDDTVNNDDDNNEVSIDSDDSSQNVASTCSVDRISASWSQASLPEVCDIRYLLDAVDKHIQHGKRNRKIKYSEIPEHVAGGETQIGKTGYKALVGILGKQRSVLTVVVTTTRDLRNQLIQSLSSDYFSRLPDDLRPRCMSVTKPRSDPRSAAQYQQELQRCISEHGVLVVNCSKYSVDRVCSKIAEVRGRNRRLDFLLIKDESDVLSRTADGSLQLEAAIDRLTGKIKDDDGGRMSGPLLILNISATLLPVFLRLQVEGRTDVTTHFGAPDSEKYMAVEDMRPIRGTFLADGELRCGSSPVPYWSDKVGWLYDDAHPADPALQRRGVLLLDGVNPRVRVSGNTRARADLIQARYPRFHAVVVWGAGMALRLAGTNRWVEGTELDALVQQQHATGRICRRGASAGAGAEEEAEARTTVSDVLSAIVCLCGLGSPVAVLGYTRLLRGESFRSSAVAGEAGEGGLECLVPTHMLCGLGDRQSFENLVQMAGRATGNFRRELAANGHDTVVLLAGWRDFDAARAYLRFQRELAGRIAGGEQLDAALGESAVAYSAAANFAADCRRTVGCPRMRLELRAHFDASAEGDEMAGRQWAEREGMPCYGPRGQLYRLESPLSQEQRAALTEDERAVEEAMYHTRHLSSAPSLAIRRAVSELRRPGEPRGAEYWVSLLSSTQVVRYDRSGQASVDSVTRRLRRDAEGRYLGGLVEQWGGGGGSGATGDSDEDAEGLFALGQTVVAFAEKFRQEMEGRPPVWREDALRALVEAWNRRRGAGAGCGDGMGGDPGAGRSQDSEMDSDGDAGAGAPGFSDSDLAALLGEVWTRLEAAEALRRCAEIDAAAFARPGGGAKGQLLGALSRARPRAVRDAEELLVWLVKGKILVRRKLAELVSIPRRLARLTGENRRHPPPPTVAEGTAEDIARWLIGLLSGRLRRERATGLLAEARREAEELGPASAVEGQRTRTPTKVLRVGGGDRIYNERPAGGGVGGGAGAAAGGGDSTKREAENGEGCGGGKAGDGRPAADAESDGSCEASALLDSPSAAAPVADMVSGGGGGSSCDSGEERRWTPRKRRILQQSDDDDD